MAVKLLLTLVACVLGSTYAQGPAHFFPYGTSHGDTSLDRNDDGYSDAITLDQSFVFFAHSLSSLYVCTNGIISFGSGLSTYTPTPFPIASQPVIAPFWGDVDIRYSGAVYYRQVTSGTLLDDLTDIIVAHFGARNQVSSGFTANWAFVVTWDSVPAYSGRGSARNTFQAVLVTDGTNSFVIYNYDDIEWTFGSASGGVSAQVGFDAGDRTNYFALPSSRTAAIGDIETQTNVGLVGRWMFRVDQAEIIDGGAAPACTSEDDACGPNQVEDGDDCRDIAPAIEVCPDLTGPIITNTFTNQFKFECSFGFRAEDNVALSQYKFEVTWLFNRRESDTPVTVTISGDDSQSVTDTTVTAELVESQLRGEHHLGKWLSCSVITYWDASPNERSQPVLSGGYWMGVRAMVAGSEEGEYELLDYLVLDESDDEPQHVYLMSTLPIQGLAGSFHHWFPIYSPNTLMVHQHRGYNCSYDFYGEDWDEEEQHVHNADYPLEVRTITTATTEPMMVDFIGFRPHNSASFDYWEGYAPASITVYRYNDEDRLPGYCVASGDPRMGTFDNVRYNLNVRDFFVMVESTSSRGFEVHVITFACRRPTTASCVCGVAMREGDTLYEVVRCNPNDPSDVYEGLIFPEDDPRNEVPSNDTRWIVQRHSSGNDFSITTPAGAQVRMYWHRNWGYNVYVNVIGADYGRVEGLCGTYNGDRANDLAYREDRWDEDFDRSASPLYADPDDDDEMDDFVRAWRIPYGESLFEVYPPSIEEADDVTDDRTQYCACVEENPENDIPRCTAPTNIITPIPGPGVITLTGPTINIAGSGTGSTSLNTGGFSSDLGLNSGGTFGSLPSLSGRRRRRSLADLQVDRDDADASNTNTNTFPTPSNITYDQALDYCTTEITGTSCPGDGLDQELIDGVIAACVADVRDLDSLEDVATSFIGQTQYECLVHAIQAANVTGENVTIAEVIAQVDELLGPIVSSMCVSDCSGHGVCADSTCTCHEGWVGSDCAIDESTLPDVAGFAYGDTCNSDTSDCTSVTVTTDNIFQSANLLCKVVYNDVEYTMAALIMNNMRVQCDLPDILIATNNLIDLSISITRDGEHYGSAATYRIYDGDCLECMSATEDCTVADSKCSVGGQCYNSQVRYSEALCFQCQPDVSQTEWTRIDGCVDAEAGVSEWGEFGDYEACTASCDYGWSYRYRSCLVDGTCFEGVDFERRVCISFRCDQDDEEVENGALVTIDGATESVITQWLTSEEGIRSLVASRLNSYCWDNPEDCCDLVGANPTTPAMDVFDAAHVRFAAGAITPDTTSDTFSFRVVVQVETEALTSACHGSSVARRDAAVVYVERQIIEDAMEGTEGNFDSLGLTLISIGEIEDEDDSDEDEDEDGDKSREHKNNAGVIGMAVGAVLAAIVVVVIIAAILVYKNKKNNTPVQPMNSAVSNEHVPMDSKIKQINVAGYSAAPPAYNDVDGLAFGPRQAPPVKHTEGHRFW